MARPTATQDHLEAERRGQVQGHVWVLAVKVRANPGRALAKAPGGGASEEAAAAAAAETAAPPKVEWWPSRRARSPRPWR